MNRQCGLGFSPLQEACSSSINMDVVKELLKFGNRLDLKIGKSTTGKTPLMAACARGSPAVVECLLGAGECLRQGRG